ncbi:unnamed protein product [Rangifer tarandus platyrhynchus]|uniref:Uncharacterized protein n=2 Tax=Rangifer tarandus platyrhynchus TaxID=3082113 RepID=A0AC59YSI6_RANTA|nr:unnamed protein product [Rangifer tarandus platyrhynchus]
MRAEVKPQAVVFPTRDKWGQRHLQEPSWGQSKSHNVHTLCVLNCLSCVQLFVTPLTIACQAPLSMGFSRQEYWSGLPCPPPGNLPVPGIEHHRLALKSPHQGAQI